MKEKNKRSKGLLESLRQAKKEELRKADEATEKEVIKRDKQREEYAKEVAEDKIDLLKLKQGMLSKEDIYDPDNETKEYTVWQKFKNFIYHNKWWLGIASFLTIIAAFLIYDKLTSKIPDINIMLLIDDTELYSQSEKIENYINGIIKDYNEDGINYSNVIYIPISEDESTNSVGMYENNITKLNKQFSFGLSQLVIADKNLETILDPEEMFVDLEAIYPGNSNIKKYAFYIKGTDFAEKTGYEGELPEDMYISVKKLTNTLISEEETMRNYDIAMETLDALIKDLSDSN